MGNGNSLLKSFAPESYNLSLSNSDCRLVINGRKLPPPSKRITLHQKGLRIISATVTRQDKKGEEEIPVTRINHLPTFEELRLHCEKTLYPGFYQIELLYRLSPTGLEALKHSDAKNLSRELLPSIDEPAAWAAARIEIKR